MTQYTPQNPPANLRQFACDTCKKRLIQIDKEGCCLSKHDDTKSKCNREGWGSMSAYPRHVRLAEIGLKGEGK